MLFYDIVFFLSPEAVAAGAKVSLVSGKYVITKAPGTTIQAVNNARPPNDQTAEVAALTQQVAQLQAALDVCLAGQPPPPSQTIDIFTVSPNPVVSGQQITVTWATSNASVVLLDGVAVATSGSLVANPTADRTYTLIASGFGADVMRSVAVVVQVPVPPGTLVPLLGNELNHQQQNWMADFVDASKLLPRSVPWVMPTIVAPMNGVKPARVRMWHPYGQKMGLYSRLPALTGGMSNPWGPQKGDQFKQIVDDLTGRPLPDGLRGINMVTPYGMAIDHPHQLPDGTPIPRAPTWLWGTHGAEVWLLYSGSAYNAGKIPGITHMHDWCVDETNRLTIYAASLGTPDSTGAFTGSCIKRVDRTPGHATATASEDATKYIVTDVLTGGIYFTGVCTDEAGNWYACDFGNGKIYKNAAVWATIPFAFALRYDAGKVYVGTSGVRVHAIDCATGVVGPDLMGINFAPFGIGVAFMTISIDRTGAFGRQGNIAVSMSLGGGNLFGWIYEGTTPARTAQVVYGGGVGLMKVGDVSGPRAYVSEPFGHYPWGDTYHRYQCRMLVSGTTSMPHELVGYLTAAEGGAPEEAEPDARINGHDLASIAMNVIRKGGSQASPFNKPSKTCLMSPEGWSLFKDCSTDEIALMSFDQAEAHWRGGLIGSFRMDDLTPLEMYALMIFSYRQSQRFLIEGGALMAQVKAWWAAKYGSVPAIPAILPPTYTPEPPQALIARLIGGSWQVVVTAGGYDTDPPVPPPAGAVIVADEGMPQQVTLPATLAPGQHALTAKAPGWASRAVVMRA